MLYYVNRTQEMAVPILKQQHMQLTLRSTDTYMLDLAIAKSVWVGMSSSMSKAILHSHTSIGSLSARILYWNLDENMPVTFILLSPPSVLWCLLKWHLDSISSLRQWHQMISSSQTLHTFLFKPSIVTILSSTWIKSKIIRKILLKLRAGSCL